MTANRQERWNVPVQSSQTCHVTPFADCHKLVRRGQATKPGARFNFAVPADLHEVAHHDLIFQRAIMPDMYADH